MQEPGVKKSNLLNDRGQDTVTDVLVLKGLDCADCAAKLEKAVSHLEGVDRVALNFATSKMKIEYIPGKADRKAVENLIKHLGYDVAGERPNSTGLKDRTAFTQGDTTDNVKNIKTILTGLTGAALLTGIILAYFGINRSAAIGFYAMAIVIGGYYPAKAGFYSLRSGFNFDMNVLMTIAVIGAVAIGEWAEAATVVFLFALGNALEAYSMEKTRESIKGLMEIAPRVAVVKRNGGEIKLSVEEIRVGDVLVVRPGERIPMDGKVIEGFSAVNQASITGESIPVEKKPGDDVFAGTVNGKGYLQIEVTKLVKDSTLSRIIKLVEEAQAQKAPSQRFVDVFAKYYTPSVIFLAALIVTLPPLVWGSPFNIWFYRGLTLLVVSCPCALVISTPVAIVSAIGNAAQNGVLVKGGAYLEDMGRVRAVAFDKTGTLTEGQPEVTDVIMFKGTPHEILSYALGVEYRSEHPIAEAIIKYGKQQQIKFTEGEHFVSITGKGTKAKIDGRNYYVGNLRFFEEDLGIHDEKAAVAAQELQQQGKTVVLVGNKTDVLGLIAVANGLRESSKNTVMSLKNNGIKTVMLTGDNVKTAEAVSKQLGISEYRAELSPEDKVSAVRALIKNYGKVAMVGDGINDAPALAAATIGIAMGGAGTDTALETADIALMADDLDKLPYAINLSRRALKTIKQNIAFSLIVKLLAVALVFPGWLNLWIAILADTGTSLVVIANGLRLLRYRTSQYLDR